MVQPEDNRGLLSMVAPALHHCVDSRLLGSGLRTSAHCTMLDIQVLHVGVRVVRAALCSSCAVREGAPT